MKTLLLIFIFTLLASCTEKKEQPPEVRIEKWFPMNLPTEDYRSAQENRPILVFYTSDWDLPGQISLKHFNEPRFMDLFTKFRVLPLIADCTVFDGFAGQELQNNHPEIKSIPYFQLSRPPKKDVWFTLDSYQSDDLYNLLQTKLTSE